MSAADDFDRIIQNGYTVTEHLDPNPYGAPTAPAVKPGLTTRGKAAITIGAAVIAGGSLLGYQSYTANAAEAELKAQELGLKADALALEKLKVLHQTAAADKKTATEQVAARQAAVDTCVKSLKNQVGKGYGSPTYGEIVEDCQSQYPTTADGTDMQAAAASQDLDTSTGNDGGGGVSNGLLIGLGTLGAIAVFGAKKGTRNAATQ
ncbi:hypothetical protein [Streptomyces sp. NBC_01422]|uniref:hypothetical protein n=1 Tax=Streptomyces sp. NBC_01422 TaxID=2903859 RepID=UPI002E29D3FD|nr:hypothetical protein [Streptomyces sp. NBC_01422]